MTKETQAWIKELEENAWKLRMPDGSLAKPSYECMSLSFIPNESNDIYIRGEFTIDQLQALVDHMKKHQKG